MARIGDLRARKELLLVQADAHRQLLALDAQAAVRNEQDVGGGCGSRTGEGVARVKGDRDRQAHLELLAIRRQPEVRTKPMKTLLLDLTKSEPNDVLQHHRGSRAVKH
jgi:hypothetical protein